MKEWKCYEFFGGLAAYSLKAMALEYERTMHRKCRHEPPISRMGSKSGFTSNVLKAWGLNRVRWSSVWMNDLDPVCHLFHLIYASSELRDAVARRMWAWVPCPVCLPHDVQGAFEGRLKPTREQCAGRGREGCEECGGTGVQDCRRLWERIRKEPVPVDVVTMGLEADFATLAHVAASAVFLQSRSFSLTPVSIRGGWEDAGCKREVDDLPRAPTSHQAGDDSPRWTVAERLERLPGWVGHGFCDEQKPTSYGSIWPRDETATRLDSLPGPGGMSLRITRQDAALCLPTGDASECLVVLDPPYEGTSGYAHGSTRATVLEVARAWHDAGALVLIHEAVPLSDQLGGKWAARPASCLRGRKSTFWGEGGEREFISFNRPPVWWPEAQTSLF